MDPVFVGVRWSPRDGMKLVTSAAEIFIPYGQLRVAELIPLSRLVGKPITSQQIAACVSAKGIGPLIGS